MSIDGGAQVTGTGVTFYNTGDKSHRYAPIQIDGHSKVTLSAPVSGPLAGVLFFQDRAIVQKHDRDDRGNGSDEDGQQANLISGNGESTFAGFARFVPKNRPVSGDPLGRKVAISDLWQ